MPTLPPYRATKRRKRARSTNTARAIKVAQQEQRVLELNSQGWTFREIGQALRISHTAAEGEYCAEHLVAPEVLAAPTKVPHFLRFQQLRLRQSRIAELEAKKQMTGSCCHDTFAKAPFKALSHNDHETYYFHHHGEIVALALK